MKCMAACAHTITMRVGLFAETGSDCAELLCGEDFESQDDDSIGCIAHVEFPIESDESIAGFLVSESIYLPGLDYPERLRTRRSVDPTTRSDSVSWILKVNSYYRFQAVTAYLAVNYMDRFLSSHDLPADKWALQLLSVACLSLAAKMEETLVPSLLDLQVEGTRFIFEPKTIRRMEFLVLTALKWRLRSITPFTFIDFFAYKADSSGKHIRNLVSHASQIILDLIHDIDFLDHCPSSMAAAAILTSASHHHSPLLQFITPQIASSWCIGLSENGISKCYKLMQQKAVRSVQRKHPIIVSHLTTAPTAELDANISSSPSPPSKRRKLHQT
ncbi:cyclin-D2-1-like [Carex rostrata]